MVASYFLCFCPDDRIALFPGSPYAHKRKSEGKGLLQATESWVGSGKETNYKSIHIGNFKLVICPPFYPLEVINDLNKKSELISTIFFFVSPHRFLSEGKLLVIDDSFEQELWNRGSQPAVILTIHMWHPDLSKTQQRTLGPI